ncbi:MAG: glycosyltransferase family 39 protein, partial [Phycisphaerae bacterium]|nr:glycosyltransferase family 39 protein [Phycisphaerae bacterium]
MTSDERTSDGRIGRAAMLLVLGVTLARIVYLVWLCPYELAADEAQYWDWSRASHLDLSYYSKGPGVAWLIAASTRVFGDAEWAIRLPAALSAGVSMLAVAALAGKVGGSRAAFAAAVAFCCVPAYHATAILMTIDSPYIACWALAALAAWSLRERGSLGGWLSLAACLGVGFLFKYTILLLVPGLVAWWWLERGRERVAASVLVRASAALVVFALIVSPVFIWNARNGWPTVSHLLGHLGAAGGDLPAKATPRPVDPRWSLEFLGTQIGLIGPILAAMALAVADASRNRLVDTDGWRVARFGLATSLPILVFYFAVSFTTDVEGNWPIAGYT